ncbi:hypothetical protein KL930_004243 [Ogataea haglerorum]|uniref:60S ribosomal protein L22 n=1 Tax=Ogataea haglerorum TaxID=1937702 RepID=A0AAN6HZD5_9ASCO|nr:uncharacterized protein KL911_004268 [Ogataea haglerorum]KAG7692896.1 hypothetical protein KL915_004352 [Ogataea haglerorum]KAG7693919.1 hypothetical protein KL951_004398 [Ogataea haglerorum]KAG7704407.1 hypothetical protein KL950_004214 [Ogataea haglerorum]KAG7715970.1 hypothetical protein KL913_003783 [Ogataea haglerorum]KAG7716464.1 hypothetical protein KL949_003755 [Ogataea haglerorum]
MYLDVFRRQETTTTGHFFSDFQKVTNVEYSSATRTIAAAITSFASSVDADSLVTDASGTAVASLLGVASTSTTEDTATPLTASASSFASKTSSAGSPDTVSPKWGYIVALLARASAVGLKVITSVALSVLTSQTKKNQKVAKKFTVDCSGPTENGVFDPASYVKYLVEHIKVDGHLGNLGNDITVSQEGAAKVVVVSTTKFSGKYLKYLSKRYLKKNQIRDWIRFVSVKKNEYQLQFYSVAVDDDEDEE